MRNAKQTVRWALAAALLSPLLEAAVVHVSPAGSDSTGNGSAERPFSSFDKAVAAASAEAEAAVVLEAGTYSSPQYSFPINLELKRSLTLRGAAGGQAILLGANETALLKISVAAAAAGSAPPAVVFESLEFRGGLTGLSVVGAADARFEARVEKCSFSNQRYQGAELVAGERGLLKAEIRENRIEGGPPFGIDLGTRLRGSLELKVVDNRIEGPKGEAGPS